MSALSEITAEQVMSCKLLTVCETMSIQSLIDFFNKNGVSGAPVLSKEGSIIGVVSLSDIVNFDVNPKHSLTENPMAQYYLNSLEGISPDELGLSEGNQHQNHLVGEIMTPEVITTELSSSIPQIAGLMHKRGIHRVFVSHKGEICGVISTLDILQLIAES